MVVVCQILIDKPGDAVYRAGETVSGVVKYAMDQPTEFKDIILSFRGESWCSWSESRCGITNMHLGIDKHVTLETSVLDPAVRSRTLPAGPYEYKFFFTLPTDLPPSFSGPDGNVYYRLLLEIQRQESFNVITRFMEAEVLVLNHLDPTPVDTPMSYRVTKRLLRPLTIGKLYMSLKAEIASPQIRPGEKAELNVKITNESIVRIKCIRAELVSTTVYTASNGAKKVETEKIKDCVAVTPKVPLSRKTNMKISVPILEEHQTVQYSKVISKEYKILVTVKLPFPYRNVSTMVPITV